MKSLTKYKSIIVGLVILFILFLIYNNFIKEPKETSGFKEYKMTDMDDDSRNILNILGKIDKIDLNPKFFNKVSTGKGYALAFNELIDYKIDENRKPPGKINPFIRGGGIEHVDPSLENENEENSNENQNQVQQVYMEDNGN